ncbi:hypothetical protein [Fluviicola sp.]|uniref:hypothetical protein n=1 Tax=Fluviicola sp. TaxID=1917219 RepID=UPI0031CEAEC0
MNNKNTIQIRKESRSLAWFLLLTFSWSVFQPAVSFAGGPAQPEASAFTPIGVSDMVDPFTGDFTYNIPLMDIEGYPINIAYNSGVTMDQEASWVGLGWNLNAGAIIRNMRGIPDDFNGDQIVKETNTKPVTDISVDLQLKPEIFGFNLESNSVGSLSYNASLSYNSYTGFGASQGISLSFNLGKAMGGSAMAGFSLSGSSENGASFSPSMSLSYGGYKNAQYDVSKTASIGTAFNSRAGLQSVSYGFSMEKTRYDTRKVTFDGEDFEVRGNKKGSGSLDASGSFNMGVNQYSPTPGNSTVGGSLAINARLSGSIFGVDAQGNIGVSVARTWIPNDQKKTYTNAFGYFHHEKGLNNNYAQLDFNRDNDQPFSKYSVNLPSAFQTYDIFSVQAQGTGGSFRPMRNDVTYVFDKMVNTFDVGVNGGFELGAGALLDAGIDIQIPITSVSQGIWSNSNNAMTRLGRSRASGDVAPFYQFIEANESSVQQDNLMTSQFYGDKPEKLELTGSELFPRLSGSLNQQGTIKSISRNKKTARELTNNQLYFLTREEVAAGMGVFPLNPLVTQGNAGHIYEITQLGQDGRRYVFSLPAYNYFQEDVTFAIGDGMYSDDGINYANDNSGIITYSSSDPTLDNTRGIDHYYSSITTPAYAHSYLLSGVLSDDYVDADQVQGPSIDDLGSYVKFDYEKVTGNQWRSPAAVSSGFHNEGMRSDPTDDKASFVYGKKDLYYLYKVETKNYVAIFKTEARHDGKSAKDRDGGFATGTANDSKLLRSITLYLRKDYYAHASDLSQANPIQKVEFDYDYHLCKGYPNNPNTAEGKLTLTKISFTYQNSQKMLNRNYTFDYSSRNPDYNLKGSDRWGTYKNPVYSTTAVEQDISAPLNNSEYPYSVQDKTEADNNASAWALTKIKLPSGGEINVTYESDDYQFVQHKKATQMFQIVGVHFDNSHKYAFNSRTQTGYDFLDLVKPGNANPKLLFALDPSDPDPKHYAYKGQQLYFRALTELNPAGATYKEKTEFISGYGIVDHVGTETVDGTVYGAITLRGEKLKDADPEIYSPIIKQGILFGRAQLSRTFTKPSSMNSAPGDAPAGVEAIVDLASAMVEQMGSFQELVTGPNQRIFEMGKCKRFVPLKSWMRLNCVSGHKMGGGSRVKEIRIKDNWSQMGGSSSSEYGQRFTYELEDGTSSGVASYEPQLGGDENPWHTAYIVNNKKRLAMDDKMYIEDPIMESQFPSPSIGYSRVVIEDLNSSELGSRGTGKVVKEFYTAKDFPTIVKATNVDVLPKNSFLPFLPKYQYLTANQGFSIELNDMHGKPKKESVYGQGQLQPLSTIEYHYQSEELALGGQENKRLKNQITVIHPDGTISQETVGVRYDEVADFRESRTVSQVPKFSINTNTFYIFIPLIIPTIYPGYDRSTNRFRSATMNKTIQKFGILEKTVANQDGSIVETNNLAYDSQTGQVLVTQTTTNFNDKVYSLNYPAYWKYESFGQASKNIMYSYQAASISNTGFTAIPANLNYFTEGDEVSVKLSYTTMKGWVLEKNANGIRIVDMSGNPISGSNVLIKVLRSGYKNKQSTSMASMTSLSNPLTSFGSNQFSHVLNAGAVEFGQDWKTYCDCFDPSSGTSIRTTNPYILGTKGNWRPIRSYTYLSGRTQTNYDGNTNVRKDGVFTAYSPFYKLGSGKKWEKDGLNWTFVSEVTQFSPNGMTMETRDALGRYSSSLFGFNSTLTTAVAANAKMQQIATGSFEDVGYNSCNEQGYFGKVMDGSGNPIAIPGSAITTAHSHTGATSIKVSPGAGVTFQNIISSCEYKPDCDLKLSWNQKRDVKIEGGTGPYTMEFEADGNAFAQLSTNNTIGFNMDEGNNASSLMITVTDSKGCKMGILFTVKDKKLQYELIQF